MGFVIYQVYFYFSYFDEICPGNGNTMKNIFIVV